MSSIREDPTTERMPTPEIPHMPTPEVPSPQQPPSMIMAGSLTRGDKTDDQEAGNVFRYTTEKTDERVMKRMKNRLVVLKKLEDVELFERIEAFHRGNTKENNYLAALQKYGGEPNGDAIVKLVYGAPFYDYILKYKCEDEKDDFQRYRTKFEDEMMNAGLYFEYEPTSKGDEVYIKVITPFDVMAQNAEDMKLNFFLDKPIENDENTNAIDQLTQLIFMGSTDSNKPRAYFRVEKLSSFANGNVKKLGLVIVQQNFFKTAKRILITNHIISRVRITGVKKKTKRGIRNLLDMKVFTEYYPLHDGTFKKDPQYTNMRAHLNRTWVQKWFSVQPYDDIREYYGEKIAFYFAWLGFYTAWLTIASFVGFIAFLYGVSDYASDPLPIVSLNGTMANSTDPSSTNEFELPPSGASKIFDHPFTLAYTLAMSIWTTLFLEFWKRRSVTLSFRWGMLDYEEEEVARPEWKPTSARKSPITGKFEKYVPDFEYKFKKFVSVLVGVLAIFIVIAVVGGIIVFKAGATRLLVGFEGTASVIASILSLVTIQIMGAIYKGVSLKLTNWENHRTETDFENALISKRFLFDFVNSYSTLFYVGLIKQYAGQNVLGLGWEDTCSQGGRSCIYDLFISLVFIFVGSQAIGQVMEGLIPWGTRYLATKAEKKRRAEELEAKRTAGETVDEKQLEIEEDDDHIPQYAKDDALNKFTDLTAEYNEMALQFGYVTLFVSAFPLGALCALLNNLTEIRLDARKLLIEYQRPVPSGSEGIGSWMSILTSISYLAVITNASLVAFSSDWFEYTFLRSLDRNSKLIGRICFVLFYEHLMFGIKLLLAYLVPDVPEKVRLAIERERYIAKVAVEGAEEEQDDEEAIAMLGGNVDNSVAKSNKMAP